MANEQLKRFPEEFESLGRPLINSDKLMVANGESGEPVYVEAEKLLTIIDNKVDKIEGKGLSTNDYSNEAKAEVAKIADKVDKVAGKGLSTNDFSDEAKAELSNKVDKIAGKGLSDNNFSNAEKQKLADLNMTADLSGLLAFKNQFLTTESGELILDINNNIIVTL